MADFNVILILAALVLAVFAIYILYAIIMFQGIKNSKGNELQLSTKNILEHVTDNGIAWRLGASWHSYRPGRIIWPLNGATPAL